MGLLANGICFSVPSLAADAYFQAIPPISGWTNSSTPLLWVNSYIKVSDVWNITQTQYSSTGLASTAYTTVVTVPSFPACINTPLANFNDGLMIGWALAAVLAAVFTYKLILKAL